MSVSYVFDIIGVRVSVSFRVAVSVSEYVLHSIIFNNEVANIEEVVVKIKMHSWW